MRWRPSARDRDRSRTATPPWFTSKPRGRVGSNNNKPCILPRALRRCTFCQKRQPRALRRFVLSLLFRRGAGDGLSPFSLLPPRRRRSQAMPMRVSPPRPAHRRTCRRPILCGATPPCDPHLFLRAPSQPALVLRRGVEDDDLLKHAPARSRGTSSTTSSSATSSPARGAAAAPHACPPPPPLPFLSAQGQTLCAFCFFVAVQSESDGLR